MRVVLEDSISSSMEPKRTLKLCNSEQIGFMVLHNLLEMDAKRITKLILAVSCPTCGAAPREKCELHSGQPRTAPHRYRRLDAADQQKAKLYQLLLASARGGD